MRIKIAYPYTPCPQRIDQNVVPLGKVWSDFLDALVREGGENQDTSLPPVPLTAPVLEWPFPWACASEACFEAAWDASMASSVYAEGSTLANTRNASKMGRYPVQRLHRNEGVTTFADIGQHAGEEGGASRECNASFLYAWAFMTRGEVGVERPILLALQQLKIPPYPWGGKFYGGVSHDKGGRGDGTAHQRLPARASSISCSVGASVLDLSREYMDMTKPGVQKPHCEPCALARRSWTGCSPSLGFPMPAQTEDRGDRNLILFPSDAFGCCLTIFVAYTIGGGLHSRRGWSLDKSGSECDGGTLSTLHSRQDSSPAQPRECVTPLQGPSS